MPPEYQADGIAIRLARPLYGLVDAGNCWQAKAQKVLKAAGLEQSMADPTFYYIRSGPNGETGILSLYVDD